MFFSKFQKLHSHFGQRAVDFAQLARVLRDAPDPLPVLHFDGEPLLGLNDAVELFAQTLIAVGGAR